MVAALGVGIVVVVIVSIVVRRRRSTEAQSVAGYRQTLDVLGHLGGTDRGRTQPPTTGGLPRLGPRTADDEPSVTEVPKHVDELGTEARRRGPIGPVDAPAHRDRSLQVMDRPARRLAAPIAAVVLVLAAAGAAAYMVVRSHHVTHPPKQAASSHSHGHTPTTTTLPTKYSAVSSTGTSATYAPDTAKYSLTIGATTSDCWMSVTSSSGTTVLAQTFAAGAKASLSLTGHSTVVIGAPQSAKLSIGGVPVVLPSGVPGPFTVTLVPR